MTKEEKDGPNRSADLRKRTEEIAREKVDQIPENLVTLSPEAARQLLYERRMHQIELDTQNEELRRTQGELEASRVRYFDLFDLAPVGYFTLSKQGLILEANLTAATLLGVAGGALVKQLLTRFILPEDQDLYYRHRQQLFRNGRPQVCELRMLSASAAPFWVQMNATVVQDVEGVPVCRTVISDITERKQAEAERAKLEAQNRKLQKAESLGRMAGAIAHHFNNKLGVVIGNLEMAMIDLTRGEIPAKRLKAAMTAASSAAQVSGQMLTYLGQSFDKRELLDLSNACRFSLPILQAVIPEDVVLDHNLPSPGPTVRANANQIQHVLTNLISNAWEAVGEGRGSIHLGVKTVSPADILATHRHPIDWQPDDNPYACLEVADTGCGIADKDIEQVFDPFFSSKFTGRGLGLPVVLGIVRAHGGAVTVESEPGRGSVFRILIPVSVEEATRRPDKAAQVPEIEGGGTVLLVEAEETLRNMAKTMITRLGYGVLEAKDGVEGLEVFRQHQDEIRCVLCDLTMPGVDGWQTLAELRALRPNIAVVLASGYDEAQVMQGDHQELPQAFLHKPYRMAELESALSAAVKQSSFEIMNGD